MGTLDPTAINDPSDAPDHPQFPGIEDPLHELTRYLSEAHAAGAASTWHAARPASPSPTWKTPSGWTPATPKPIGSAASSSAIPVRFPAPTDHGQTEGDEPAIDWAGFQPQTRFEAGYQVMARYPDNPGRGDDLLETSFPLTPGGFQKPSSMPGTCAASSLHTSEDCSNDAYRSPAARTSTRSWSSTAP